MIYNINDNLHKNVFSILNFYIYISKKKKKNINVCFFVYTETMIHYLHIIFIIMLQLYSKCFG